MTQEPTADQPSATPGIPAAHSVPSDARELGQIALRGNQTAIRGYSHIKPNPRVSLDEDGTLDDFAATGVELVHFEAIDDTQWYATIVLASGETWQLNFGAHNPRARGYARAEQVR